ncbi:hypothetical protein [Streptomyces smyrnaeus]|uniref:hypothetical protein n=1 Tax=Streptomyces smyrnaeus TaxID=1387713 RepID=UPI0036A4AFE0
MTTPLDPARVNDIRDLLADLFLCTSLPHTRRGLPRAVPASTATTSPSPPVGSTS